MHDYIYAAYAEFKHNTFLNDFLKFKISMIFILY